jgi:hypothetical protein
MTTRYGEEQLSGKWTYPTDVDGFLGALKTDVDHPHEARSRVEMFMMTSIAKKMPAELRTALVKKGLLDPKTTARGPGFTRRD